MTNYERSTGKGWDQLVDPLIELCILHGQTILQIKEKFGGLRFYVGGGDGTLDKLIDAVESYSQHTCETCGESGYKAVTTEGNQWIVTLCKSCRVAREEARRV